MDQEAIEPSSLDNDRERVKIERERLDWEKSRAEYEQRFLNRNFGVVITSIVSLAAIIVSVVQLYRADISKQKELLIQEGQKQVELDLQKLQVEREWKLSMVKFISEHRSEIFEGTGEQRENIKRVMLVAFPPEVALPFFEQASRSAPENQRAEWVQAQEVAGSLLKPRIYVHIRTEDQREYARQLEVQLEKQDYEVPGIQRVNTGPPRAELRYFHQNDAQEAGQIASLLANAGQPVELQNLSVEYRNASIRPKHYELWLSK
jgi:hypothetical protein